jgi:hypothetical protein
VKELSINEALAFTGLASRNSTYLLVQHGDVRARRLNNGHVLLNYENVAAFKRARLKRAIRRTVKTHE